MADNTLEWPNFSVHSSAESYAHPLAVQVPAEVEDANGVTAPCSDLQRKEGLG